jgi:hypothetical protein
LDKLKDARTVSELAAADELKLMMIDQKCEPLCAIGSAIKPDTLTTSAPHGFYVHRAALAVVQTRMRLSARLGNRITGQVRSGRLKHPEICPNVQE